LGPLALIALHPARETMTPRFLVTPSRPQTRLRWPPDEPPCRSPARTGAGRYREDTPRNVANTTVVKEIRERWSRDLIAVDAHAVRKAMDALPGTVAAELA
jgi:hypothetical protein